MGNENSVLSAAAARHLLRRTGFGVRPTDVERILRRRETRGEAADRLLAFRPSRFRPSGKSITDAHNRWIRYMLRTRRQLQEKLVLFWHDHFATSNTGVGNAKTMATQNRTLRRMCKGNLKDLVKEINRDAAMIEFLDTQRNRKEQPNENYARELMELFTLGVTDATGVANYEQQDIVQIARAFTGWRYAWKTGVASFRAGRHDFSADYPQRGPKIIFRTYGGFGPGGRDFSVNGEGAAEIDTVIDILFAHRDSTGYNTVARHIARKLFAYFAYPNPSPALIDQLVAASGFDTTWDIAALLRAMFVHDAFYETAASAPYTAATKKSVKWPVDYVISTLRTLRMRLKGRYQIVAGGSYNMIRTELANMGQVLFEPPSVFGWDWEAAWLSSATLLARYGFARDLVAARNGGGRTRFRPERLIDTSLSDPGLIVDAVTDLLGVTGQMPAAERTVLVDYLTDGGLNPTLDLLDQHVRNTKLHGLFALVLQSPAYQLH